MTGITQLTRIFRTGSVQLNDPDPGLNTEQVKDYYSVNYPHLSSAIIEGPTIEGNNSIFEFLPAPVKTKG
jgi:PRTRC genetic system protein C